MRSKLAVVLVSLYSKVKKWMQFFIPSLFSPLLIFSLEIFIFSNYARSLNLIAQNFQRRQNHFDALFQWIRFVHFLSKDGKDASYEGRDGWNRHFHFNGLMMKIVSPSFTLSWRVNSYVFRLDKARDGRNEKTKVTHECFGFINQYFFFVEKLIFWSHFITNNKKLFGP